VDRAGKIPPAFSGGNELLSSGARGNPTDASGAFRPGPRAQTEALMPFFQNSKLIQSFEYCYFPLKSKGLKALIKTIYAIMLANSQVLVMAISIRKQLGKERQQMQEIYFC
jgi:hypothetical protein